MVHNITQKKQKHHKIFHFTEDGITRWTTGRCFIYLLYIS